MEAVFRSLKSELGLRPIYHHKPVRSEGHLFLTVIAYQLVQVIRKRLKQRGEVSSWTTLRRILVGVGTTPSSQLACYPFAHRSARCSCPVLYASVSESDLLSFSLLLRNK